MEITATESLKGLSETEVSSLRLRFGKNTFQLENSRRLLRIMGDVLRDPMFLLLVVSCLLYFLLGETNEGIMMAIAMCFVAAISIYQDARSSHALEALNEYTEPRVTAIRDGGPISLKGEDLVPGDVIVLEEGEKVPADATILQSNDLSLNESIITGEAFPVEKSELGVNNFLYQGTILNSGKCYARVTATGNATVLGKLGKTISAYSTPKTLLQHQLSRFIRYFTIFGASAFVVIWVVNYARSGLFAESLLLGLTMAMAVIPEEIPVAFSSFMALGTFHMARRGIISRQPQIVENLGAVSVICLDKTGTITENRMEVKMIYDYQSDALIKMEEASTLKDDNVLYYALLASELNPFDAMEKAICDAYEKLFHNDPRHSLNLIHEYNLNGRPPMMTHVYQNGNVRMAAAKGAVEKILSVCKIDEQSAGKIASHINSFATAGYRVLGIASATPGQPEMPSSQEAFDWKFEGLVALYDPPRKNVRSVFEKLRGAGVKIKLLTGDYSATAINIATQVGMRDVSEYVTGEQVMSMSEDALVLTVQHVNIFARMFPEAKLKVINALKATGEIVAMTGDGVNDGPALKAADVGIAMGEKGTEIARRASDLVLTDDDLEKVVEAIQQGRGIFSNFKKAVRYIISIHIPIILTASLPLLLGWRFPNIFMPVHIIFLELIMGPTCSIFFEREPLESDIMKSPPRDRTQGLFKTRELLVSALQGLMITVAILILYYTYMTGNYTIGQTRAIVFTTLVLANIFLTFANRSFSKSFFSTIRYKNNLAPFIVILSILLLSIVHLVPFARNLFGFSPVGWREFGICVAAAFLSVSWFELFKVIKRRQKRDHTHESNSRS